MVSSIDPSWLLVVWSAGVTPTVTVPVDHGAALERSLDQGANGLSCEVDGLLSMTTGRYEYGKPAIDAVAGALTGILVQQPTFRTL
jgi:hypothetical protein